jgi:cysteine desulfurase/selenocysteine lyase
LAEIPGINLSGPRDPGLRGGNIAFSLDGVHPHDIATILDESGVAVRAGHHCARPLHRCLGIPATARASFYVYSIRDDVDALVAGLHHARRIFGVD